MDYDQINAIKVVAEVGTLAKASKILGRTVSSISGAIKNIEVELNAQIFDRSTYRLTLTPVGKLILEKARIVLNATQVMRTVSATLPEAELTIALDPTVGVDIIRPIIALCSNHSTQTRLNLKHCLMGRGVDALFENKAALAVALRGLAAKIPEHEALELFTLYHLELTAVVSGKVFKKMGANEGRVISEIPQVLVYNPQYEEGNPHHIQMRDEFHCQKEKRIYVNTHALKQQLITEGLGWGRMPVRDLEVLPQLTELKSAVEGRFALDVCMIRLRHKIHGPTSQAVWDYFRSQAEKG